MSIVNCSWCGKTFNKKPAQIIERKTHFCCHEHYALSLKGKMPPNISGLVRDGSNRRGVKLPSEQIEKHRQFMKGKTPWNKGKKTGRQSEQAIENSRMGMKRYWDKKGRKTPINQLIRGSVQMTNWRKSVFERDNYTCRVCERRGVYLEAHHIKKFSDYPELRFELSNGATLCRPCHDQTKHKEEWFEKELKYLDSLNQYIEDELYYSLAYGSPITF